MSDDRHAIAAEPAEPADPATELNASERLALSRERLRRAMLPRSVTRPRGGAGSAARATTSQRADDWLGRLQSLPGVALVIDVIESWWRRHPMRTVTTITANTSQALVRPLAQRHPIRLVLAAFVAGAILTKVKPWRWLLRRTLFAGLFSQIALRLAAELPVDEWIAKLNDRH